MQSLTGQTVDVRYYGSHDQISTITGEVVDHDSVGIVIQPNHGGQQLFPWASVQRVILDERKDSLS